MLDFAVYFFATIGFLVCSLIVAGYLFFKLAKFLTMRRLAQLGLAVTETPASTPPTA